MESKADKRLREMEQLIKEHGKLIEVEDSEKMMIIDKNDFILREGE